jgi:hypothetical protein
LERGKWTIEFSWVKAHVGIYGNELEDKLATDVACNKDTTVCFNRIPKSTFYKEMEEEATQKMAKRMGKLYKGRHNKTVLPKRRDKLNVHVNPSFPAIVTG